MSLTVGSLFSGIGGLDLGLERAGMTVKWQSEIDPYAARVLEKHWPDVPNLGDIREIVWEDVEHVDVICGGYPCQPFSHAGTRTGATDPRHLWPHMRDAVSVLRPRYALLENVRGHLSLGFGQVLADLASIGYDTDWQIIPAAAVGAPHRRDRVFVVAYPNSESEPGGTAGETSSGRMVPDPHGGGLRPQQVAESWRVGTVESGTDGTQEPMADPHSVGLERPELLRLEDGIVDGARDDGWWAVEPDVGRVAHGVPARMDRLRCLGNAVVPQVAELVGRRILEAR